MVTAKNNEKWVRAIGIPEVIDGKCVKVYGLFQDIDSATRLLNKSRVQEEKFRKTFENAANGMAIVGLDGKWERVNKVLSSIVGYTSKELLSLTFQDITHPDDLDLDLNSLKDLLSGKIDNYSIEKRYYHKDGSIVWVLLAVSLISDINANPQAFYFANNRYYQAKEGRVTVKSCCTKIKWHIRS